LPPKDIPSTLRAGKPGKKEVTHMERIKNSDILANAKGISAAIKNMGADERKTLQPTPNFAADYNTLRKLFIENYLDKKQLAPPEVKTGTNSDGLPWCDARYGEILAYCEQICEFAKYGDAT
jgi:hypothetical protein